MLALFLSWFSLWQKYCDVSWAPSKEKKKKIKIPLFLCLYCSENNRNYQFPLKLLKWNILSTWGQCTHTSTIPCKPQSKRAYFHHLIWPHYLSARKIHHYQAEICAKSIEPHIRAHCTFKVIPGKKKNRDTKTLLILHTD